jgi:hypothetical protein
VDLEKRLQRRGHIVVGFQEAGRLTAWLMAASISPWVFMGISPLVLTGTEQSIATRGGLGKGAIAFSTFQAVEWEKVVG